MTTLKRLTSHNPSKFDQSQDFKSSTNHAFKKKATDIIIIIFFFSPVAQKTKSRSLTVKRHRKHYWIGNPNRDVIPLNFIYIYKKESLKLIEFSISIFSNSINFEKYSSMFQHIYDNFGKNIQPSQVKSMSFIFCI